jgi:hypothetical protein
MSTAMTKRCEGCGQRFSRRAGQRPVRWEQQRFCTAVCAVRSRAMPLSVRFEAKVDRSPGLGPNGDCHLWTAALNHWGYGKCSVSRSRWDRAHRVAWFLATGAWPTMQVLHHCDTPACVRFEHLFLGTQADNMTDMSRKGRGRDQGRKRVPSR